MNLRVAYIDQIGVKKPSNTSSQIDFLRLLKKEKKKLIYTRSQDKGKRRKLWYSREKLHTTNEGPEADSQHLQRTGAEADPEVIVCLVRDFES